MDDFQIPEKFFGRSRQRNVKSHEQQMHEMYQASAHRARMKYDDDMKERRRDASATMPSKAEYLEMLADQRKARIDEAIREERAAHLQRQ